MTATATGAAIVGAQVSLADLNMAASTLEGGSYEISDIPAGTHEVVIGLIGYQAARLEVVITDGERTRLDVALTVEVIELGGLVAVGSRAKPRTVTESPVPVDVIRTGEIVNQGDTDFANLIRNVVPSFNVNIQPISDAATFARPANLRGLAPDHTLMLVNGKRRHRTAVITWYGNGLADGSQGPDIALISGLGFGAGRGAPRRGVRAVRLRRDRGRHELRAEEQTFRRFDRAQDGRQHHRHYQRALRGGHCPG